MPSFADRVIELHRSLDAGGVPHGFGGAIALIYAVQDPRLTHDIDVNISVPADAPQRAFRALPASLPWTDADVATVSTDGQVRLRWDPTLPVDLFFPQHQFHQVVAERTRTVPFAGEPLPVISPTDLTVFKTLFNRAKDWPDIDAMLRAGTVDTDEALDWVGTLLGADHPCFVRLAELVEGARRPPRQKDGDPNVWANARARPRTPPDRGGR